MDGTGKKRGERRLHSMPGREKSSSTLNQSHRPLASRDGSRLFLFIIFYFYYHKINHRGVFLARGEPRLRCFLLQTWCQL